MTTDFRQDMTRQYHIIFLCFFLFTSSLYSQKKGQALIDSLQPALPATTEDTNRVNILAKLSHTFHTINPDSGIIYGENGLTLARRLNYKTGMAVLYKSIMANYYIKADNKKSLEFAEKAIALYKETGDRKGLASAFSNTAVVLVNLSNYTKALEYDFAALKINEEIGNEIGIASNQQNLGILYYNIREFDKGQGARLLRSHLTRASLRRLSSQAFPALWWGLNALGLECVDIQASQMTDAATAMKEAKRSASLS